MPSSVSHAFIGVALASAATDRKRIWIVSAFCSALPDIDVVAVQFFSPTFGMWAHRGFSHSLAFAFLAGLVVVCLGFRSLQQGSKNWWLSVLFFFLVTASHGFADALNEGSVGVDFFAPLVSTRYVLPYRPIPGVGISLFFSTAGQSIFLREIAFLWLPTIAAARLSSRIRRRYLTASA